MQTVILNQQQSFDCDQAVCYVLFVEARLQKRCCRSVRSQVRYQGCLLCYYRSIFQHVMQQYTTLRQTARYIREQQTMN
jgi:hypothetical protein